MSIFLHTAAESLDMTEEEYAKHMEEEILAKAAKFFNDRDKAVTWFATANPLLGGISPNDMVALGKTDKLAKFVREQLADNARD